MGSSFNLKAETPAASMFSGIGLGLPCCGRLLRIWIGRRRRRNVVFIRYPFIVFAWSARCSIPL
jgi:hypothetical protein